jgi:hypothetical protein
VFSRAFGMEKLIVERRHTPRHFLHRELGDSALPVTGADRVSLLAVVEKSTHD